MRQVEAIEVLKQFDRQGRFVFTKHDFVKVFPADHSKALDEGLRRLVRFGLLKRACRAVYVNEHANSFDSYVIEHVAKALRRGEYSYVSLESMLSEYGVISQIPIDRLTVMTTGRRGIHKTLYGVIEFTHTGRAIVDIIHRIKTISGRPLRIATQETALRDLKRVGRNVNLINQESINE